MNLSHTSQVKAGGGDGDAGVFVGITLHNNRSVFRGTKEKTDGTKVTPWQIFILSPSRSDEYALASA